MTQRPGVCELLFILRIAAVKALTHCQPSGDERASMAVFVERRHCTVAALRLALVHWHANRGLTPSLLKLSLVAGL
jgi:hypothetical protein